MPTMNRLRSLVPLALLALSARAAPVVDNATDFKTVEMIASTWYAGWHSDVFPLANVSWDKYNHITYAFAITTPDVTQLSLDASNGAMLPEFVKTAHQHDVKALVSVGGWTGSRFFSTAVATPQNRTLFVKTITDLATQYQLDGIDFDWEYPNNQGIGCNTISVNDTANFLSFLQELRQDPVGKHLILSAATSIAPFKDATSMASTNVTAFAEVLDFIAVMNYDIWGSWSSAVGPNAPLNDTCVADPSQAQGSAVFAVNAWTAAGMPQSQIVLGVASYGHSFYVTPSDGLTADNTMAAYPPFNKTMQPAGDKWDGAAGLDVCGVEEGIGGNFDFWGLIDGGFLTKNGTVAPGITYRFDNCSQTPYVYNATSGVMVSYDDARSFEAKGQYISKNNLRGFAMWEAGGDYKDILLDAISRGAGIEDAECELNVPLHPMPLAHP